MTSIRHPAGVKVLEPIPLDQTTRDQVAAVMLQHGTPAQQAEALGSVMPVGPAGIEGPVGLEGPVGVHFAAFRDELTAMVDAAMVEMSNIQPPLRRSECERLIRAAYGVPVDPCPGCMPGGVCAKPECGRKQSSELMRRYGRVAAGAATCAPGLTVCNKPDCGMRVVPVGVPEVPHG